MIVFLIWQAARSATKGWLDQRACLCKHAVSHQSITHHILPQAKRGSNCLRLLVAAEDVNASRVCCCCSRTVGWYHVVLVLCAILYSSSLHSLLYALSLSLRLPFMTAPINCLRYWWLLMTRWERDTRSCTLCIPLFSPSASATSFWHFLSDVFDLAANSV